MEANKKLPIFYLEVDLTKSEGVNYIALVDEPAIERNFIAFEKQKQFFKADPTRRIVSGALMIADLPIYRRDDTRGEYYVVFNSDSIMKIVQNFFKMKYINNVNFMHDKPIEGVYLFESFIIDSSRGLKAPEGFDGITEGSWFGSMKVENDQIWNDFIKTGIFKGFSVEGIFELLPAPQKKLSEIEEVISEIEKIESK